MTEAAHPDILGGNTQSQLRSIVARVERLNEDADAIKADIREVYLEAKGNGFDTSIIRAVIRERKMDRAKRDEKQALIDLYMAALGMT